MPQPALPLRLRTQSSHTPTPPRVQSYGPTVMNLPSIDDINVAAWVFAAATLLTGYVLFTGTHALLFPVHYATRRLKGIVKDFEEDTFDSSLLQSIGGIIVGFAVHVYLVLVIELRDGQCALSLDQAMGYSLLPRILLIAWSFAQSHLRRGVDDYQFEHTSFLKINTIVMTWTSFSLLFGVGNPTLSTKVFSTMALVKALALVLKPVEMTQKIFGVNVSEEERAQSCFLSGTLGYYLGLHALLMMALAYGIDPNVGVWTSALVWVIISIWIRFVVVARMGHMGG